MEVLDVVGRERKGVRGQMIDPLTCPMSARDTRACLLPADCESPPPDVPSDMMLMFPRGYCYSGGWISCCGCLSLVTKSARWPLSMSFSMVIFNLKQSSVLCPWSRWNRQYFSRSLFSGGLFNLLGLLVDSKLLLQP